MTTRDARLLLVDTRAAFAALALLFRYPDAEFVEAAERAWIAMRAVDADAADILERFAMHAAESSIANLQAAFTSTFDLAPSCSPYAGEHLFKNDASRRTRLMLGLRASCRRHGIDEESELPDHIAGVVRLVAHCKDDEWAELGSLVVLPALGGMDAILAPTGNPYRHLVAAARQLSAAVFDEGGAR